MPPPPATAFSAVYASDQGYVLDLGLAHTPATSYGSIASRTSCDAYYQACLVDAEQARTQCVGLVPAWSWADPQAWLRRCENTYATDRSRCERFNCAPGSSCQTDRQNPAGQPMCCPDGYYGCGGACRPPCAPGFRSSSTTCQCECEITCAPPHVLNSTTCRCECPPCPPGYVVGGSMQNLMTCQCYCPTGWADCGGRCVRLGTGSDCHHCGDRCGPGQGCCPPDLTSPLFRCTDLTTTGGCGTCGNARPCGPGEQCCVGAYGLGPPRCANLMTSPTDCGACLNACPTGMVCVTGQCVCPPGLTYCPGVGCVDLQTALKHCGACGRGCGLGACVNGQCQCVWPEVMCNGGCADLNRSNSHCGGCNHPCTSPRQCLGGHCGCGYGTPCGANDCCVTPQICCGNTCVDPRNDNQHCGSCTSQCNSPVSQCVQSDCVCSNGYVDAPLAGASPGCCPAATPIAHWNPAYPGNEDFAMCCPPGDVPLLAPWVQPLGAVCCPPGSTVQPLMNGGWICFLPMRYTTPSPNPREPTPVSTVTRQMQSWIGGRPR